MENFAQTGAQRDDLFNEFTNGEESMQTRAQDDLFGDDFEPVAEVETVIHTPAAPTASSIGRGRESGPRGRGRGRGRGGHTSAPNARTSTPTTTANPAFNLLGQSRHAPNPLGESKHAPKPSVAPNPVPPPAAESGSGETPAQEHLVDAPHELKPAKPAAVRGDRSSTGGNARTKLTEEQLAAKISSMQLKNANLEAAHARAQADADSFAQRESEATKKRQEERRDRQQMMGEREKNRQRKLKAQEGREWDSNKQEEDYSDRRRGYGRGAHGGVTGTRLGGEQQHSDLDASQNDGREYMYRESRGGGRGRGGRPQQNGTQRAPKAEEFPALSTVPKAVNGAERAAEVDDSTPKLSFPSSTQNAKNGTNGSNKEISAATLSLDDNSNKQSWADMVEDSRAR